MLKFFSHVYTKLTGDLFDVIENDDVKILSEIIKNKDAANNCCTNGCYLLYDLCARGAYKSLIWLLKLGADPDLVNKRPLPWTPLRFAVRNKVEHLIRILIIHGANPDKPEPDSAYATPRNMANPEIKKVINQTELLYKSLLSLKTDYETLKSQADAAYKKPDIQEAKLLYQAAAERYEEISKIWEKLFQQEANEILKSYYQEQQTYYVNGANQLRNLLIHEKYSTSSEVKEENPSFQIRQRKADYQKQQSIYEEQSSVHKLII